MLFSQSRCSLGILYMVHVVANQLRTTVFGWVRTQDITCLQRGYATVSQ